MKNGGIKEQTVLVDAIRIYGLGDWDMLLLLPRLWTVGVGLRVPRRGLCAKSDHDEAKGTCELCPLL
jgi:hypothetical protein